jgi:peptidoglycan/xylan/chitin deacetylase (PgdA/CDA1 family)
MSAKKAVLHISKWLGLFRLARSFSPPGLRILCYHGFAMGDEAGFRPKLFILPGTFEKRLRFLSAEKFPVFYLGEALERLRAGTLPAGATAITIDDGFYSVLRCALPLLQKHSLPSTLYVTTYYCVKETPIFRLVVQYLFWKTRDSQLELAGLAPSLGGIARLDDPDENYRVMWEIIHYGETELAEEGRGKLARALAERLHLNYDAIREERSLSLVTVSELRELNSAGVDIQLHTHRHRLPDEEPIVRQEIADNRAVLEPIAGKPLGHLCYPSGIWSERSWAWLSDLRIQSATTCDPGLNFASTPALGLKRFLDGENISQIEFESEMCGFNDLLRNVRARLRAS